MRIRRLIVAMRSATALGLLVPAIGLGMLPATARAQISFGLDIRIGYAPPPLPRYNQPPLPGPDYLWVPGYWAWSDWIDDYYWVDGYWDQPPERGLLWTPAWWGWDDGAYRFHDGYWGREVGWYGGIDYGHGYHGHGWEGGHWDHGHVAYNRAVINVTNVNVTNVYYHPVTVINNGPRVSYNGGNGGVIARPRPEELRATQAPHIAPTPVQQQRVQQSAADPHNVATHITPAWRPPAVHRISTDGVPIARETALAHGGVTAGAPPAFQRPGPGQAPGTQGMPANPGMAAHGVTPGQALPGQNTPGTYERPRPATPGQPVAGVYQPPHPAPMGQPAPGGYQAPRQNPYGQPARGTYQQPRPAPMGQPAPGGYQAPRQN
ncbi:hypothetical protein, partial [Novosphingobium sp.]|uniref:hypothetical protein n=1 Tax=Novosphingobium sp. TaxID=1874826 RepID=UPI00333E678A